MSQTLSEQDFVQALGAVFTEDEQTLRRLFETRPELINESFQGKPLLVHAAENNKAKALDTLLELGADTERDAAACLDAMFYHPTDDHSFVPGYAQKTLNIAYAILRDRMKRCGGRFDST